MTISVKYATIIVRDMEESIKFYSEVMGFKLDSQYYPPIEGTMITLMKGQTGAMVELIKNSAYEVGFYSVGMEVEDLETTLEELKNKGAKIIGEIMPTLVGKLAFIEDPNGVKIALIEHDKK
ncbi:MAG: VOC family protein [Bacillota bacterium]